MKKLEAFKKWLKFNCPSSATADGWDDWEEQFKKEAPYRYFVTHRIPRMWRKIHSPVTHRLKRAKEWVIYRTVARYHIVDTKLKPGYYDKDTILLNAMFSVIVEYVEVERGTSISYQNETFFAKHTPFYYNLFYRNPAHGIAYLEWEMTLDDPKLPINEQSPHQAANAREILALYIWWTHIRPNREELPCPARADTSDRSIMYRLTSKYKEDLPDEYAAYMQWQIDSRKQEEDWETEDEDMIQRLLKIRKSLWT